MSYVVIRRECQTSLPANRGRWHTSSMNVSATLTPTPLSSVRDAQTRSF